MALVNKAKDMTPFDMKRPASKQNPLLLPIIWCASFAMTRQFGLKIEKVNMDGLKPPFLVLGTHQGFSDYYIGPLSVFPRRAMYVSDMEGFAAFGLSLYRGVGCIGKRRYVADINVMHQIRRALKNKQSVFIYPESRHSNIGITSRIPNNMGRLAKALGVPLVILSCKGSYLANPFWDEDVTRKVPIKAKMELVYTAEQLKNTSASEIQKTIEDALQYDEYQYQHDEGFLIKGNNRARGMEQALYKCYKCGTEHKMYSSENHLVCRGCNERFELSEDGYMVDGEGNKIHPPKWYKWQEKEAVKELMDNPEFVKEYRIRVEALPNEKGFIDMGEGKLTLDKDKFTLKIGDSQELFFPHKIRESVQNEYNYRKKGPAVVLSTRDCTYYLYSHDKDYSVTKLQFWGEYLYDTKENKNATY